MTNIQPVILCGGSGARLWPLSRPDRPKPFIRLLGERTLFQQAIDRVSDREMFAEPIVVTGLDHVSYVRDQAEACRMIVEPCGRNTAPAIALAAALLDPDTIMLVCPSDHFIADEARFREATRKTVTLAADGWMTAVGIAPDRPETGYGYIEQGAALGEGNRVARFVEKPDLKNARKFLASGNFVWNAGIFALRAGAFLDELKRHRPAMADQIRQAVSAGHEEADAFFPEPRAFSAVDAESVDYAVMEETDRAAVVAADIGWSDIGNWDALAIAREGAGSKRASGQKHRMLDCKGVAIESEALRVSAVGLDDVIIVADGEDILVVSRSHVQQVGELAKDDIR